MLNNKSEFIFDHVVNSSSHRRQVALYMETGLIMIICRQFFTNFGVKFAITAAPIVMKGGGCIPGHFFNAPRLALYIQNGMEVHWDSSLGDCNTFRLVVDWCCTNGVALHIEVTGYFRVVGWTILFKVPGCEEKESCSMWVFDSQSLHHGWNCFIVGGYQDLIQVNEH